MKPLIIIIALFFITFAADPLDKVYDRYKIAESKTNYKKSDDAARILTNPEWSALPEDIKDQWPNYGEYQSWARAQINAGKQAIRDQLETDRERVQNSSHYDASEKTQYRAELQTTIDAITDI